MNEFLNTLRAEAPDCQLLTDPDDTAPYLTDWRDLFHGTALGVARPRTVEQVAAVMRVASRHGVGVVPQGGNTGMAGGATPTGPAAQVVLSLGRMNAIRRVDRVGMTLVAEAGCILQTAKDAAEAAGRFLPISFAAQGSATVGGMIATNAGGINALRYGTVRQMVLGLEAVLADGTVVSRLQGLRKDNAGYDWKQWLIGSEGTLGVVTAAVLRLTAQPRARAVAFVAVASPEAAVGLLERLQDSVGDSLSACELMSGDSVARSVRVVGGRLPVSAADWYMLVEVGDSAPAPSERLGAALEAALETGEVLDAAVAESLAQNAAFWALRENISEAERQAGPSVKHDVAVAVADVPAFIDAGSRAVAGLSAKLQLNAFGHLGDGNIHFNVLLADSGLAAGRVNHAIHDIVASFGGSIAAEHGIGQYRIGELLRLKSSAEVGLMNRVKRALDPQGMLNPGKVLPREQPR